VTLAQDIFTTAIGIDHTHKTRQTLQRHRASGSYDANAANRLLRNNARHACRVYGVNADRVLLDNVVRLLQVWCMDKE
jgi:hypothetical protein